VAALDLKFSKDAFECIMVIKMEKTLNYESYRLNPQQAAIEQEDGGMLHENLNQNVAAIPPPQSFQFWGRRSVPSQSRSRTRSRGSSRDPIGSSRNNGHHCAK
jgi:hypothetical protein